MQNNIYLCVQKLFKNLNLTTGATESGNDSDDAGVPDVPEKLTQTERYDRDEKSLLTDLIRRNHNVVCGTFSNTITHDLKTKVWWQIADEINKAYGKNRTVKSIRG